MIHIPSRYLHEALPLDRIHAVPDHALSSVVDYSTDTYEYINYRLRSGGQMDCGEKRDHRALYRALCKLQAPMTVWRGVSIGDSGYVDDATLPVPYIRDVWRDKAWVSTSLSKNTAQGFASLKKHNSKGNYERYLMALHLPEGLRVIPTAALLHRDFVTEGYAEHMGEREITLPPRLRYEVVKRRQLRNAHGHNYIRLDVNVT